MNLLCNCKALTNIKVAADVGADPLWCAICGYNLDMDKVEVSDSLKETLRLWIDEYGNWVDWESDILIDRAVHIEKQHNELGLKITEKVKDELNGKYNIVFAPSLMTK
ncbi:hypothetical protein [Oceanobacillus kapialis]|uniref:Uncharacterized protein n=1 Tax=Oceanobacillus kapialis TaxID=481353 RepID=A0ABW5PY75_9BACI